MEINSQFLKPIVEKALELSKFNEDDAKFPNIIELLDKSVYLAILRIGVDVPNEKSFYLSYLRNEIG